MTTERVTLIALEMAVAAIHPFPLGMPLAWRELALTPSLSESELEIVLALPMFLRLYLLGRCMMLHSRLVTDTASRSIGALNKVRGRPRAKVTSLTLTVTSLTLPPCPVPNLAFCAYKILLYNLFPCYCFFLSVTQSMTLTFINP